MAPSIPNPNLDSRPIQLASTKCAHTLGPLALNTATPASAHYGMQGAVPCPSNLEARGSARSKMTTGLVSKQQKTDGFIKINLAYILNSELVDPELIGSSFDYDLSKTHWMLDFTTKVCNYFRDHPTFPSPQQVLLLELHSLQPYYKDWWTSGRACEKFVLIYNANQYLTSTGKRNVEDEVLDLPCQSSVCPQSMSLQLRSMKTVLSLDSESSVVLHGSNNSNPIDNHDYTPCPTRTLNVKHPKLYMQPIETQTSPPTLQSKATQTSNQVTDERVDILCPEPLHQVMNKLVDDFPGGKVRFSDIGIMQLLGGGTLPIVTKACNCLSPRWKVGSMLTIVAKDLDSNYNLHATKRLSFEKSEVVYSVNCSAFIGSGAFMNCYEAKVLIDGQAQEMVVKQELDAIMTLESYQALAQRYPEAETSINIFKMAIEANSVDIPYDLVKNFIVHQGRIDEPGPKDIYLFEEKIEGKFVKFFGNLFFSIEEKKENKAIYQIMHTLSHKTYHDNHGRWMIADLQGKEEGLLTDIAIIDEEYLWTMGNTDRIGLIGFCLTAKCNFLCKQLGLPDPQSASYPKIVNGMVVAGTESEVPVLDSDAERSWELLCGARTLST
ncbi:kinase-like domain-containing protein [Melampsora americana]|nr:kinase-like domain-containing protein [Melampsora americana]